MLDFKNSFLRTLSWFVFLLITIIFFWIISDVLKNGIQGLSYDFLTLSPENSGRSGGIAPIIISTGLVLIVCLAIALPLGLATAIWISEYSIKNKKLTRTVQNSLDILAGVPSIVFGLFGNVFFCKFLGLGFSILSGGLTLSCMVLPILIRSATEGFHSIPQEQRLATKSLGLSRSTSIIKIYLPIAMPGLIAGLILGTGRALAETAALIFTSGYVDRFPESLMDSGRVLSIHIYDLSMNIAGGDSNAYSSALILLILIFLVNETTLLIQSNFSKKHFIHRN